MSFKRGLWGIAPGRGPRGKKRKSLIGAKYVKIDEDAAPMGDSTDEDEPLSWRLDPEESLSDWKIVVETDFGETTYHVHRHILARGDKKCEYFSTLFNTKVGVTENTNSTSRITLNVQDSTVFPLVLDFLYSGDEMYSDDLNRTALDYLRHASERNDEYIENAARNLILDHFEEVEPGSLSHLPLELFRSIVCSPGFDEDTHEHASIDVCHFLERNAHLVDSQHVNDLTSHLSKIHPTVAQNLMNIISKLDPEKEDEEGTSALDSLRKKCAVGIVESIVNQPDGVDVDEWMDSVYKPTANGQCAEAVLKAALKRAKVEATENEKLKERISTLEGQVVTSSATGRNGSGTYSF